MTELISKAYLTLQRQMHADPRGYGQKGDKWADQVAGLVRRWPGDVLDYGCGQGSLGRALAERGVAVAEYDPAVKGKSAAPAPADLVVCTDVLEHVEPDRIEAVLDHLKALTRGVLFAVIATTEAGKTLPDGRNAHILIRDEDWWTEKLGARFDLVELVECRTHKEFAAVWSARP